MLLWWAICAHIYSWEIPRGAHQFRDNAAVDSATKPVDGHILLVQIDGKHEVYRLVTIVRRGLESLIDKDKFIAFGDEFLDDGIAVEGVVTFIINDAGNQVFDDTPCI